MRRLANSAKYALMFAFAVWCGIALRGDLAQMSLEPLLLSWELVVLAAALSLLNYALRIVRWRWYLGKLGYRLPRRFAALTFTAGFAYTLSPGKIGEMIRARYYVPLGIPLSDVTAAFFAERLLDLVAMVLLAALLLTSAARYQGAIIYAAVAVAAILVLVATLPWTSIVSSVGTAERIPRVVRSPLVSLASAFASTRPLMRPGVLAGGFALGMLAWGLEGAGLGVLSSIYPHIHLAPITAAGIYGVAVLIGGLSFMPGGLGGTEAVMTTLLVANGCSVSQALLITLLCRLLTLWFAVLLGWIAVFLLRNRSLHVAQPWQ